MQLLTATIANGGDIQGVVNMMTQQTAQKALAAAVLEQLLKRKVSRLHEDDATTLASQPEIGAVKHSFFSTAARTPASFVPSLGVVVMLPATKLTALERYEPAAPRGLGSLQQEIFSRQPAIPQYQPLTTQKRNGCISTPMPNC